MSERTINEMDFGSQICFSKILVFCLKSLWQAGPFLLISLVLTTILHGMTPTVGIWIQKSVINAIVDIIKAKGNHKEVVIFFRLLALQFLILIFAELLYRTSHYLTYLTGKILGLNMTGSVLSKASLLDLPFYESSDFYDMITRAKNESSGKPLLLIIKVNDLIRSAITFVSMGCILALFSFPLFAVMIIMCSPLFFIEIKYGRKFYLLRREFTEDLRKGRYLSGIMTTRYCKPEILSYGTGEYLLKKWLTISRNIFHKDKHLTKRQHISETVAGFILAVGTMGTTAYIVFAGAIRSQLLNLGEVVMYISAFAGGVYSLKEGFSCITGIYEDSLFIKNFLEFDELEPIIESFKGGKSVPSRIHSIELKNVSFRYPRTDRDVLKNINLTFNNSQSTLIVGANGAGKTTLIKLISRLYDPTEGYILLNGVDIREFDIKSLRERIGIIFQEFIRYALSAKENIGCGCVNELENEERIVNAARLGKADSFIQKLPLKYETLLSKEFKGGQELSLGQWQRVCIARLFMKNSSVLILDEPTASLDIETEAHLLREIAQLSKNKICIFVSHRMFRKGIAGQIVVLQKGQIIEAGSYEDLIVENGEFAKLCRLYHNMTEEELSNLPYQINQKQDVARIRSHRLVPRNVP